MINGEMLYGCQNIMIEQLRMGLPISAEVGRFYSGEFAMMMFGLPDAALAMYHTAFAKNKRKVKGLLLSAALASFLTGITEPIEFSFLICFPVTLLWSSFRTWRVMLYGSTYACLRCM